MNKRKAFSEMSLDNQGNMKPANRTIAIVAVALAVVALFGAAFYYYGSSLEEESVDYIEWGSHSISQLGIGVEAPIEWPEFEVKIGPTLDGDDFKWFGVIGEACLKVPNETSYFKVLVKQSEKGLVAINKEMNWVTEEDSQIENCVGYNCLRHVTTGWQGRADKVSVHEGKYSYGENILIDGNNGIYYLVELGAYQMPDLDTVNYRVSQLQRIVDSLQQVDFEKRPDFSSPELGFGMDLTPVWPTLKVRTGPVELPNSGIGNESDALGEARNVVGGWISPDWLSVRVIAKKASSDLARFNADIGHLFGQNPTEDSCGKFKCYRLRSHRISLGEGDVWYPEIVLIDARGVFYYFEIQSVYEMDRTVEEKLISEIDESIDSFRLITVEE